MKFILIILLFFYILMLLTRYLGPLLFKHFSKKIINKFQSQFHGMENEQQVNENEPITPSKNKKSFNIKEDVGEYIDYEEIN